MLTGEKVRLREYRKEDIEQVLRFVNEPAFRRLVNPRIPYPWTLEDEQKWFEKNSAAHDTYSFAIETLAESKYIGGCGVNEVDWKNSVAVAGIFIGDGGYRGKGYGTDAMRVLIRFVFDQMNMNKIKLHVFSINEQAIRCYEKCGFKVEGVLRQEIFRDGAYCDDIVMGLLREEYRARGAE